MRCLLHLLVFLLSPLALGRVEDGPYNKQALVPLTTNGVRSLTYKRKRKRGKKKGGKQVAGNDAATADSAVVRGRMGVKKNKKKKKKRAGSRARKQPTSDPQTAVTTTGFVAEDLLRAANRDSPVTNSDEPILVEDDGDIRFTMTIDTRVDSCDGKDGTDFQDIEDLLLAVMRIGFLDQDVGFSNVEKTQTVQLEPLPTEDDATIIQRASPPLLARSFPTDPPTSTPSLIPSELPSSMPSVVPSLAPSGKPSYLPSIDPTDLPSNLPSLHPTNFPSIEPSLRPSIDPSNEPSNGPSSTPTTMPSNDPTGNLDLALVDGNAMPTTSAAFTSTMKKAKGGSGSESSSESESKSGRRKRNGGDSSSDDDSESSSEESGVAGIEDSTNSTIRRELRARYIFTGYVCRRCKGNNNKKKKKKRGRGGKRRRLQGELFDHGCSRQQMPLPGDPLSDVNFATRLTTALRIMIVDTFALDPESCFFNMVDSDATVELSR